MPTWQNYLEENKSRFLDELLDFIRIPSISALPEHTVDVQRAGEWVAARLARAGIENIQTLPTGGHPVVYGDWLHAPGKPTILIYGHFDVQPVDPVDLWTHPPFAPTIIDNRIYARGATDDKGNMFIPIVAAEALLQSEGELPVNIKFFIEGQEEIGSPNLPEFVPKHTELFACDLVLSADGGQWSETEPGTLLSLKGVCGLQIDVTGAKTDLHSGGYGGTIQNPLHALVRLLDSMRGADGKILVEGFYDNVVDLSDKERAKIAHIPFDEAEYLDDLGVSASFGEPGYTTRERAWIRPTLELNGMWGGFQGEGTKTVLPSAAYAKITCRLVADQDPLRIIEVLTTHIKNNTPPGVEISVKPLSIRGKPYNMPANHPGNQAARTVLAELYNKTPYYTRSGGSIPVCGLFLDHLKAHTVNFAFGLRDEKAHAPNEFYRISSFERGQQAYCTLLHHLASQNIQTS